MLTLMAAARGGRLGAMDERYCIDNGAMISWCGQLIFSYNGAIDPSTADV